MSKLGLGDVLKQKAIHFAVRKLASCGLQGIYGAAWSPNSRSLVFSSAGQLHLFDVTRGTFQPLKARSDFVLRPTFSPDGKTLAYYAGTLHGAMIHWEVWLHDLATGKQRTLPSYRLELPANPGVLFYFQIGFTLSWHPDGYHLACTRLQLDEDADDLYSVEMIDVTDAHTVSLQNSSQKQRYPIWSPNGKHLAYTLETKTDVRGYEVSPLDLCVTDSEGKHPRKIWDSSAQAKIWPFGEPQWKADSSGLVVFAVSPETEAAADSRLWKPEALNMNFVPLEGTPQQVLNLPTGIISISSDLQAVVYLDEDEKTLLYSAAPFAHPRVLDALPAEVTQEKLAQPFLSPDGKSVAVLPVPVAESKRAALHLYDVESERRSVYPLPR